MEATFAFPKNEKYLDFQNHKSSPFHIFIFLFYSIFHIFRPLRILEQQIYRVLRDEIQFPIWCLHPHHKLTVKGLSDLCLNTACEGEFTTSWCRSLYLGALLIIIILLTKSRIIQMLSMQSQETDISRQRRSRVRECDICHIRKPLAIRLPVMISISKHFMKDFHLDWVIVLNRIVEMA